MTRTITQVFMSAPLLLLPAGWSSALDSEESANPYAFAPGEPAAFSSAFKSDLPADYTIHDYLVYVLKDV